MGLDGISDPLLSGLCLSLQSQQSLRTLVSPFIPVHPKLLTVSFAHTDFQVWFSSRYPWRLNSNIINFSIHLPLFSLPLLQPSTKMGQVPLLGVHLTLLLISITVIRHYLTVNSLDCALLTSEFLLSTEHGIQQKLKKISGINNQINDIMLKKQFNINCYRLNVSLQNSHAENHYCEGIQRWESLEDDQVMRNILL